MLTAIIKVPPLIFRTCSKNLYSQKDFNKTVDEKLAKLDNLVLKVDSLAQNVEIGEKSAKT